MHDSLTYVSKCLIRERAEVYHSRSGPYLSSHLLAKFRESPALYLRTIDGLEEAKDRSAYLIGRAAHTMILEGPSRYSDDYVVGGPINPKTNRPFGQSTKAFAQWRKSEDREPLTREQDALINNLSDAVLMHPVAERLLDDGAPEGVLRAEYCDISCQARLDWFSPQYGIVDLKTCNDLTWFESDARRFGYLHQMAFYRAVVAQFAGMLVPVHIIAVEKKEPFRCGVWQLGQDVLGQAQRDNEDAIERLKECQKLGNWPTGYEKMRQFDFA